MTLFEAVMEAWTKHAIKEEELCNEMLRLLGVDPDDLDAWPFEDTGWDWHDLSVELYGVKPGLLVMPEQLDRFWLTGFTTLFVNYADGTERSYSKARGYAPSEIRESRRTVPSCSRRQVRAKDKRISELEEQLALVRGLTTSINQLDNLLKADGPR